MNELTYRRTDYVGPVPGSNTVYVIVADRAKFDQINRPMTDHRELQGGPRVLTKTIGDYTAVTNEGLVVFQHWLEDEPTKQEDNTQ